MNVAQYLVRSARLTPELPALANGTHTYATFREFALRAGSIASALREKYDLFPGDRVGLIMSNTPQYIETMFGAWYAGLVIVPINAKLHPREFHYILEHSGAAICFVSRKFAADVGRLSLQIDTLRHVIDVESTEFQMLAGNDPIREPVGVAPDDPAWLFYTSGTTGRPKGAVLTHRNMATMTLSYLADLDRIDPGDAIIHAAPKSHGSGIYSLPHVARGAVQVSPESGGFDPSEIVDLVAAYRGTTFFFAPTMIVRLMNSSAVRQLRLENLKSIIYGGGPMYVADTVRALEIFGDRLIQIYGQGESPMTITYLSREAHAARNHPRYLDRLASVGVERTDTLVRVVDEAGNRLAVGDVGEIVVAGDVVMKGYWRNPEATAKALRDGWLYTGDMGAFDEDGFLTLKDRSKDVIIAGGSNIYPREVEEVLLQHPDVVEVSVVGRPHPEWGEEVVAFVVVRPESGVTPDELDKLCLDRIARFKRPKDYVFVESLPKNNYGKVLKTELRRKFELVE